jgi:hypothetical protein
MQNSITELFDRHNLSSLVPDIQLKAKKKAKELSYYTNWNGKMLFPEKQDSAAAAIYITYFPIEMRATDYHIESDSYQLKEYPDTDNILLSYLSTEQQIVAKSLVMHEFLNIQHKINVETRKVDKYSTFEVQTTRTGNGETRYRIRYIKN